jgi:histone H3/H4
MSTKTAKTTGLGKGGAKRHKRVLRDTIRGITKPALLRLGRRAGVKRISGTVYEETRSIIKVQLENLVRTAVTITEHLRRKTVEPSDVFAAARLHGTPLVANAVTGVKSERSRLHRGKTGKTSTERKKERKEKTKVARETKAKTSTTSTTKSKKTKATGSPKGAAKAHRFRPGTVAMRVIKKQQKSDKLIIPMVAFSRLVREIGQDYHEGLRFAKSALNALQILIEHYIIHLYMAANNAAIHAKRVTLFTKDLQLARRLRGERA